MPQEKLQLAHPSKKEMVCILEGDLKGRYGTVKVGSLLFFSFLSVFNIYGADCFLGRTNEGCICASRKRNTHVPTQ